MSIAKASITAKAVEAFCIGINVCLMGDNSFCPCHDQFLSSITEKLKSLPANLRSAEMEAACFKMETGASNSPQIAGLCDLNTPAFSKPITSLSLPSQSI